MPAKTSLLSDEEYTHILSEMVSTLEILPPKKKQTHFEEKKEEDKKENLALLADIEQGIFNDEFTFYLQPQCNSENHSIIGMEALVRWVKPDGSIVPPDEFIPVLEKTGLIIALDMKVWEKVCRVLGGWVKAKHNVVPISINVSIADIQAIDVAEFLLALCDRFQVPHKLLRVEITESMMAQNLDELVVLTSRLQELGFKVLMDDFGSGYSSLNMLKDTNVDVIKLDMKLIELNNDNFEKGRSIVESVVSMAHQIGLPVVAEGVENQEQLRMLQSLDCIYTQGFKFYKPMPIENAEVLLEQPGTKNYWDLSLDSSRRDVKEVHYQFVQNIAAHACALLSEYLLFFARVNIITGDFELLNRDPAFPAPSGGMIGNLQQYADLVVGKGIIAPEFVREYRERTNVERLRSLIISGARQRLFTIRTTIGGDLEWITIGFTAPKDCSPQNPWGVFFVRKETFNSLPAHVLGQSYEFDTLTGLFNYEKYKSDIAEIPFEQHQNVVCIYCDVIGLHEVNNHIGHAAGDEMLTAIGLELRRRFPDAKHYRLGGDEFLVLAFDEDEHEIDMLVELAKKHLSEQDIDISIGIASSADVSRLKDLVSVAEQRMFANKREQYAQDGKGRQLRMLNEKLEDSVQEMRDAEQCFSMILPNCTGVYVVNMLDDTMRCVRAPEGFKKYARSDGETFSDAARKYTYDSILPKYQSIVLDLLDFDTVRSYLWAGQEIKRYYERKDGICFDLQIYPYSKDTVYKDYALWVFTMVPKVNCAQD